MSDTITIETGRNTSVRCYRTNYKPATGSWCISQLIQEERLVTNETYNVLMDIFMLDGVLYVQTKDEPDGYVVMVTINRHSACFAEIEGDILNKLSPKLSDIPEVVRVDNSGRPLVSAV